MLELFSACNEYKNISHKKKKHWGFKKIKFFFYCWTHARTIDSWFLLADGNWLFIAHRIFLIKRVKWFLCRNFPNRRRTRTKTVLANVGIFFAIFGKQIQISVKSRRCPGSMTKSDWYNDQFTTGSIKQYRINQIRPERVSSYPLLFKK